MKQEIEIFVLTEPINSPQSYRLNSEAVVEDLLKQIDPERFQELRITIVGEDLPCDRNHKLHEYHHQHVHCHHHTRHPPHHHERLVEIVVNGRPEEVGYVPWETGTVLVKRALEKSKNSGQNIENWQLRDENGTLLEQTKLVRDYGLRKTSKLFLNLKAGGGGHIV